MSVITIPGKERIKIYVNSTDMNSGNCGLRFIYGLNVYATVPGVKPLNAWREYANDKEKYIRGRALKDLVHKYLQEIIHHISENSKCIMWLMTGSYANVKSTTYLNTTNSLGTEDMCAIFESRPELGLSSRSHGTTNHVHPGHSVIFTFTYTPYSMHPNHADPNLGVVMDQKYCPTKAPKARDDYGVRANLKEYKTWWENMGPSKAEVKSKLEGDNTW